MSRKKTRLEVQFCCQNCRKDRESTRLREIYLKNFQGPCGDSFCFASCDSSSCRPVRVAVCDECEAKLKKPLGPRG